MTKQFIIRHQRSEGQAFRLVGAATFGPLGEVLLPPQCDYSYRAEIEGAIRYLTIEKAAISARTISGFEIEKKELPNLNCDWVRVVCSNNLTTLQPEDDEAATFEEEFGDDPHGKNWR